MRRIPQCEMGRNANPDRLVITKYSERREETGSAGRRELTVVLLGGQTRGEPLTWRARFLSSHMKAISFHALHRIQRTNGLKNTRQNRFVSFLCVYVCVRDCLQCVCVLYFHQSRCFPVWPGGLLSTGSVFWFNPDAIIPGSTIKCFHVVRSVS